MMANNIYFSILLLFLSACSIVSSPKTKGPFSTSQILMEKEEKYFEMIKESQKFSQKNRVMASQSTEQKSLRRIYFRSLYSQHLMFSMLHESSQSLEYCPQFHQDFRELKDSFHLFSQQIPEHKFSLLGLDEFSSPPQELHAQTAGELHLLCEEGVSEDYYKFDNLVTYFSHQRSFHQDPSSLHQLLKMSLYRNNFYLTALIAQNKSSLKMMKDLEIHQDLFEGEFLKVSQTQWFSFFTHKYMDYFNKQRISFLKKNIK